MRISWIPIGDIMATMTLAHIKALHDGKAAADAKRMAAEDQVARRYLRYLKYDAAAFAAYRDANEPVYHADGSKLDRPMYDRWRSMQALMPGFPTDESVRRVKGEA
jgi:hypothetical protein